MTRTMLMRETERIADSGGVATALWTHAAWLASFLAIWGRGPGIPLLRGTIYEQTLAVQWMLMAFLLPWTAARAITVERGDAIVRTSALVGLPPSRILSARVVALSVALALVVAAGLPIVVIAQRMSDVSPARVVLDETAVVACGLAVATLVTALQQALASRVVTWLVATGANVALVWGLERLQHGGFSMPVVGTVVALSAGAGAMLVAIRSDAGLRYLSEETA